MNQPSKGECVEQREKNKEERERER